MKITIAIIIFFVNVVSAQNSDEKNQIEIEKVLQSQVNEWNNGSVEGFMDGYLNSETIRFASGGKVTYGWQAMLERYKKNYSTKEKMGKLNFHKLDIRTLSESSAIVFGEWEVQRTADTLGGLFTLLMEKNKNNWKVIHDHTSSK